MNENRKRAEIDMERALLDPAAVFATPEGVLDQPGLSDAEKIEILRRWEYDAAETDVAREEGMPGGPESLQHRISLALNQLTGGFDTERTGPDKHHGLDQASVRRKKTPKA